MNQASHDSAYRSAMTEAMGQLSLINEEATSVRSRMDQLDLVLEALKPFLTAKEDRHTIESAAKPVPAPQMVRIAAPDVVPPKMVEATDPIQCRINSVLGLTA